MENSSIITMNTSKMYWGNEYLNLQKWMLLTIYIFTNVYFIIKNIYKIWMLLLFHIYIYIYIIYLRVKQSSSFLVLLFPHLLKTTPVQPFLFHGTLERQNNVFSYAIPSPLTQSSQSRTPNELSCGRRVVQLNFTSLKPNCSLYYIWLGTTSFVER